MGQKKKQPLFVLNSLILQLLCQNCHRIMLYSSPLILEGCFERPNQKEIGVLSLVVLCRWASLWSWTVGNPACSRRMEPTIPRASHYFCGNVWQDPASSDTMQYGIQKLWYLVYKLLTWFRVGWAMTDFAGYCCGYNNMFRFVYMLLFRCSNGVEKKLWKKCKCMSRWI